MSQLLTRWVNSLALSVKVQQLESDFSNGYLLGEVIEKCFGSDAVDLSRLSNSSKSATAAIKNLLQLQGFLKGKGIKVSKKAVKQIIAEEPGAAASILFKIKTVYEGKPLPIKAKGRDLSAIGHKPPKARDQERELFDRLAKMTLKERALAIHDKRFEDLKIAQDKRIKALEKKDAEAYAARVNAHRNQRRELYAEQVEARRQAKEASIERWKQTELDKLNRERKQLSFELGYVKRKQDNEERSRQRASNKLAQGIEEFDTQLKRLGLVANEAAAIPDPKSKDEPAVDIATHLLKLQNEFEGEQKNIKKDVAQTLERVKEKRRRELNALREKETRQRRQNVDQKAAATTTSTKKEEEMLLLRMLRERAVERRTAQVHWEKKVKKRFEAEAAQKESEAKRAKREAEVQEMYLAHREQFAQERARRIEAEVKPLEEKQQKAKAAKKLLKRKGVTEFCATLSTSIVQCALALADARARNPSQMVPAEEWADIKAQNLQQAKPAAINTKEILRGDPEKQSEAVLGLDEQVAAAVSAADVDGYKLARESDGWQRKGDYQSAASAETLEVLQYVAEPYPYSSEFLQKQPACPLRLCVLGAPLSGKTTVAEHIAKHRAVPLFSPEVVLAAATNLSDEEAVVKEANDDETLTADQLAHNELVALRAQMKGKGANLAAIMDQDSVASVLVWMIRKANEGKRGLAQFSYILDGFPRTRAQAVIFSFHMQLLPKSVTEEPVQTDGAPDDGESDDGDGDQESPAPVEMRQLSLEEILQRSQEGGLQSPYLRLDADNKDAQLLAPAVLLLKDSTLEAAIDVSQLRLLAAVTKQREFFDAETGQPREFEDKASKDAANSKVTQAAKTADEAAKALSEQLRSRTQELESRKYFHNPVTGKVVHYEPTMVNNKVVDGSPPPESGEIPYNVSQRSASYAAALDDLWQWRNGGMSLLHVSSDIPQIRDRETVAAELTAAAAAAAAAEGNEAETAVDGPSSDSPSDSDRAAAEVHLKLKGSGETMKLALFLDRYSAECQFRTNFSDDGPVGRTARAFYRAILARLGAKKTADEQQRAAAKMQRVVRQRQGTGAQEEADSNTDTDNVDTEQSDTRSSDVTEAANDFGQSELASLAAQLLNDWQASEHECLTKVEDQLEIVREAESTFHDQLASVERQFAHALNEPVWTTSEAAEVFREVAQNFDHFEGAEPFQQLQEEFFDRVQHKQGEMERQLAQHSDHLEAQWLKTTRPTLESSFASIIEAEAEALDKRHRILETMFAEIETSITPEVAQLGTASLRSAISDLPDEPEEGDSIGAGDITKRSERLLEQLQNDPDTSLVSKQLAGIVSKAVTIATPPSPSDGSANVDLSQPALLSEALHTRKLAFQSVHRFEALHKGCAGGVSFLEKSMHSRIAALLKLEDGRLSHLASVLDKLAYAGEAVIAWRANNESKKQAAAATTAHRLNSSLRAAALKEDAAVHAKRASKLAETALKLDCAVLAQRVPERPTTLFSIEAILNVGLELKKAGIGSSEEQVGRPFILQKPEFASVLKEHWLPKTVDDHNGAAFVSSVTEALCTFQRPGVTPVDIKTTSAVDWREFVQAALVTGGLLPRLPSVTELCSMRTAMFGASPLWHRAEITAFNEDDSTYDVAFFTPNDTQYSEAVYHERRVQDKFVRPVGHKQRMKEAVQSQWDDPPLRNVAAGQKYAVGTHVEARRVRLDFDEFANSPLWFDGLVAPDIATELRELYFALWSDEERPGEQWLDPLQLILTWSARRVVGADPRHCVGFHQALVVLSRPVRPRYLPKGVASIDSLQLSTLLERHVSRGFANYEITTPRVTFADVCSSGSVPVTFSPSYAIANVYKIALQHNLF